MCFIMDYSKLSIIVLTLWVSSWLGKSKAYCEEQMTKVIYANALWTKLYFL